MKNMSKGRGWCMTLNNWSNTELEVLKKHFSEHCKYWIIGQEVGASGTKHLQIYVEYRNEKSMNVIKKVNSSLHLEKRKGTMEEASNYCKKDGNFIEEGKIRGMQGSRKDIHLVLDMVNENKSMVEIIDTGVGYQALRYGELIRKYKQRKRTWKPIVYWFWGKSGTGKSMTAFEMSDEKSRWVSLDSIRWWDGYDEQEDVIIDDFRGSDCRLKTLLRTLDRYEYRVEYKGGSTQLLAKRIWITCTKHPRDVYSEERCGAEEIEQLIRRIDYIQEFEKKVEIQGSSEEDSSLP